MTTRSNAKSARKPKGDSKGYAHRTTWDDETVSGSAYGDRPEVYKARPGSTDIVRIVTHPISYFIVSVNPKNSDKGFSTVCRAEHEDIMEGITDGNDREAKKRAEDACPALAAGYPVKRRFVCLLYHVARVNSKGQAKKVRQVMPFVIDGGKFENLRSIAQGLPVSSKTNKKRGLHSVELQITCTDAQFQKLNFSLAPTIMEEWAKAKPVIDDAFDDGWNINGEGCSLIEETMAPESLQQLKQSIERVSGKGRFEDDSDEWDEDGDTDGDGDEFDDEEPAPKRRTSKKSSGKKQSKKSSGKRTRKEPEPDEDDDLAEELDEALDDEIDEFEDDGDE